MIEKLSKLFFEEVTDELIIIKYKNKKELTKHLDDDLTDLFNKQHNKELKTFNKAKIIMRIIPLIIIIFFFIIFYRSNIERFNDMSFFTYLFKYSLHFYLSLIIYFNYLILIEFISMRLYNAKFNAINNPNSSINHIFSYFILEIICLILHIVTLNTYHLTIVIILSIVSLIMLYLHIRYLIKMLNIAYQELKGLV